MKKLTLSLTCLLIVSFVSRVTDVRQFYLLHRTIIADQPSFVGSVKVESVGVIPRSIGILVQTRGIGGTGDALMSFLGLTD